MSTAFHTVSGAVEHSEPAQAIAAFTDAVKAMVDSVSEMHNTANAHLKKCGAGPIDVKDVAARLAERVDGIVQQIVAEFAEPQPEDKTESYKAAERAVVFALDKIEDAIVAVYGSLGIPESEARAMFGHVKPHVKHAVLVLCELDLFYVPANTS